MVVLGGENFCRIGCGLRFWLWDFLGGLGMVWVGKGGFWWEVGDDGLSELVGVLYDVWY